MTAPLLDLRGPDGLTPGDRQRAFYSPYTPDEEPFVEEIAWAADEQVRLRLRQPAEPDSLWLRSRALAHRILHNGQKRIESIRKQRSTPPRASRPATPAESPVERPAPSPLRPIPPHVDDLGLDLEPEVDLSFDVMYIPALAPRHLLLTKTVETLDSYARLLDTGHALDALPTLDPRLDPHDLLVLQAAFDARLHLPIDPDNPPADITVHTSPVMIETYTMFRDSGRLLLRRHAPTSPALTSWASTS